MFYPWYKATICGASLHTWHRDRILPSYMRETAANHSFTWGIYLNISGGCVCTTWNVTFWFHLVYVHTPDSLIISLSHKAEWGEKMCLYVCLCCEICEISKPSHTCAHAFAFRRVPVTVRVSLCSFFLPPAFIHPPTWAHKDTGTVHSAER